MSTPPLKIYSFICSRNTDFKPTTIALFKYLSEAGVEVKSLIGQKSIFEAYFNAYKRLTCFPDDIIIFCHDDIEILTPKEEFIEILKTDLDETTGFVGVAGTRKLNSNAIWWDWTDPQYMRGTVYHGTRDKKHPTLFGPPGNVVVMDGLFLACRAWLPHLISLKKPATFEGDWDFYDLSYTLQSYLIGKTNKVVPIMLRHESIGELVGRDSWHKNRTAFIELYKDKLPCQIM